MSVVAFAMASDTALIRITAAELHPFEIAFFRNLFSLLLIVPWLWRMGPESLRTDRLALHLLRAALKLVTITAFFFAVKLMPLAEVTAIIFTTPLFVALGAALVLGEVLRLQRGLAILIGFVGVLIVLRPGSAVFDPIMLLALAAAVGQAAIALLLKFLARSEPTHRLVGLNLILTVPLALLMALPFWTWPSAWMLLVLLLQGALGALAQTAVTRAMALADASVLMPFEFIRLPLVVLIAWLAFGEASDFPVWLGAAVIFGSTFYLTRSEARHPGPLPPLR